MEWISFAICIVWLLLKYRASHIYKSECVKHTSEVGFALGSIFSAITDGLAWYGIFRITGLFTN